MRRWQVKTATRTLTVEARYAEIRDGGVLAFTDGAFEPAKRAFARHAWVEFEMVDEDENEGA
jgi:hypothetical protein